MNIWKSPVLYFGLFLLILVGAALVAPYVVDWGKYRSDLEAYGTKLTGRPVEISGPIAVRLFPWPRLTLDEVRIGNVQGGGEKPLVVADQLEMRLNLASLLNGAVQVERIDVVKPVIALERRKNGDVNWVLTPTADIRNSSFLGHVLLDQIYIREGKISFDDQVRGVQTTATEIEATLSAPNIRGPWRSTGSFSTRGNKIGFNTTTVVYETGKPLSFSLRLNDDAKSGFSFLLDGTVDHSQGLLGSVQLQPQTPPEGKGDLESNQDLLGLKAKIEADFSHANLTEIDIRPTDPLEQGTVMTGTAEFEFGLKTKLVLNLTSPRFNLRALGFSPTKIVLRDGGELTQINSALRRLPDIEITSSIKIAALTAGDSTLENIELQATASRDSLRIQRLAGSLPGRSQLLFNGTIFSGIDYAELGGDLSLESYDLRGLVQWLNPAAQLEIAQVWSGSRGHLKAQGAVNLSASRLELRKVSYELDSQPGNANFSLLVNGERPIMTLWLDTQLADIDQFIPQGLGLFREGPDHGLQKNLLAFIESQMARDLKLTFQAGELRLNGVTARDVMVDVETSVQGIEIKTIEVGSVGGANLKAEGVVLSKPEGLDGQIDTKITADAPYELLRLVGLLPRGAVPEQASVLGKTDLILSLIANPTAGATTLGLSASGSSGEINLSAETSFVPLSNQGVSLNGSATITAGSSQALAVLLGVMPAQATTTGTDNSAVPEVKEPASLTMKLDGVDGSGFKTEVSGKLFGADFRYVGSFDPAQAFLGLTGALNVQAPAGDQVMAALRMPRLQPFTGPLSLSVAISGAQTGLTVSNIQAQLGEVTAHGQALLRPDKTVKADLEVSEVSLGNLLLMSFLPWNGKPTSVDQLFAQTFPRGLKGEVWVRPKKLEFYPGYVLDESQLVLTSQNNQLEFNAYGKQADGAKTSLWLLANFDGASPKISGNLTVPFDLSKQLKLVDGQVPFAGLSRLVLSFAGEGRSPAAALASLSGEGSFSLSEGRVFNLAPEPFAKAVAEAKTPDDLTLAFQALHGEQAMVIGETLVPVKIALGMVAIAPFGGSSSVADLMIKPVINLNDATFDINLQLTLRDMPDMQSIPAMTMRYAGPAQALRVAEDSLALTSFLGFKVLNLGVAALEKLQIEQQRLAAEEAKMQAEDMAKLEAYNAQRAELRLRLRELRIQAEQRARDEALRQQVIEEQRRASEAAKRDAMANMNGEVMPPQRQPSAPVSPPPMQVPYVIVPPGSAQ